MTSWRARGPRSRSRPPSSPPSPDVTMVVAVVLVVVSVIAFAVGLILARAVLVFASIGSAVLAKVTLEVGRRAAEDRGPDEPRTPAERMGDEPPRPPSSLPSAEMARRSSGAERLPPVAAGDDHGWRFDELVDDDSTAFRPAAHSTVTAMPQPQAPPSRPVPPFSAPQEPAAPGLQAPAPPQPLALAAAGQAPPAAPQPASDQIDRSLDRFGERLVDSLNQLFDEYIGEALGAMQQELAAERQDLNDLRTQVKAVVKGGARREDALREELAVTREAADELRAAIDELREQVEALAETSSIGLEDGVQEQITRVAEEVRALRKRVALGGRRGGGGGGGKALDPQQVRDLSDAVVAAILDAVEVGRG